MEKNSIVNVPLLSPGWKKLAFVFFSLPVVVVIGMAFLNPEIDPNETTQIIYGFWAIGFGILNLTRENVEDEMIQKFRQQAFQTGFFWLIWGLGALMLINYLRFDRITSEIFTAYLVLFLLNMYIYAAFQYQKYIANKEEN
jgi:cell division protein FtsW (lipid II flippase)